MKSDFNSYIKMILFKIIGPFWKEHFAWGYWWCPAYERKWKEWKQGNTIKEKHLAAKEEKTVYQAKHEAYIFLSTVRLENKSSDEKFRTKFKLSDMREYQLDTDLQRLVLQRIKVNACLLTYYQHCVWTCLQERRSLWKFFMIFVIYLLVWSLYGSCIVLPVVYCVCVKHISLWNCLCSSPCFSASLIQNIGELRVKIYFPDPLTTNTINDFRDSFLVLKIHGCY